MYLSLCSFDVMTRYRTKPRWDRNSGFSPYDSLESLVCCDQSLFHWVKRFPSNESVKVPPYEIVILPLLARLAWERLQTDTYIYLNFISTRVLHLDILTLCTRKLPARPQPLVRSLHLVDVWPVNLSTDWTCRTIFLSARLRRYDYRCNKRFFTFLFRSRFYVFWTFFLNFFPRFLF